jgi:DNA-binding NarL/FixJ family response regulator
MPAVVVGREAIAATLELVMRELAPRGAVFLPIGGDGVIRCVITAGKVELAEATDLPEGPSTDFLRMPIRRGEQVVAWVAVWRAPGRPAWTGRHVRLLAALQPLIELAYAAGVAGGSNVEQLLPATLTPRQRQVASMLLAGASNAEIARALSISAETAKSHTRAVLAKLGSRSRRELVVRLGQRAERPPSGPVGRVDADETAQRLLSLVLDWASERIGAVVGACAVFTARKELLARAAKRARRGARQLDPQQVRELADALFPAGRASAFVNRAVTNQPQSTVVRLQPVGAGDRLGTLAAALGLTAPLLMVLRLQGRLAGVIWLSGDANTTVEEAERAQALRNLQPLLELAFATRLARAHATMSTLADLSERGLTPRELAVARLAVGGHGNAAIATLLGITQSTVKHHMTQVLQKCGVRSRTQLIALLAEP